MKNLLEQYTEELKDAKQIQKELITKGNHGQALKYINTKIEMLNKFVNDLKKAIASA
ncbi:hypothetical protein [Bacteroides sp.]|uniref:hypothetical protein n=1 Tax=Bacteroides sp. TaxID=29523 RepID=UPI0026018527|nr:hypothetical protein [Bacteroides sp.]MDD3039518.1 hypothetical protein [Bacteroides sp.]